MTDASVSEDVPSYVAACTGCHFAPFCMNVLHECKRMFGWFAALKVDSDSLLLQDQ